MKTNPVGWFEIYVQDMARARKFYHQVFQCETQPLNGGPGVEMFAFPMDTAMMGAAGTLVKMEGFTAGRNSVIVYFRTDDCAVEEKRIVEAGGKIHKSKFSIGPNGFIALAYDSEGNIIGLHSMK